MVGADNEPFAKLTDPGWSIMGDSSNSEPQRAVVNLCVNHLLERKEVSFKTSDCLETKIMDILSSDFKTSDANGTKTLY